jgi:hypothetical protein
MSIYGTNPRFKLGTYINQSIRTTFDKSVSKVSYSVFDQNAGQYIRKVGNRYTTEHLVFDLTLAQKNALLAMNGTKQTYTPFYDKTNNRQVYVDAYFDPYTYFPSSYVKLILTDVDVDNYPTLTNSGLLDWEYIGYCTPDGTNDYVIIKNNPAIGDTYSILFNLDLNNSTAELKSVLRTTGGTTGFIVYANSWNDKRIGVQLGSCALVSSALLPASGFTKVAIAINKTANTFAMYFNGTLDSGAGKTGTIPSLNHTGMRFLELSGTWKVNNFILTNDLIDGTDATNYQNNAFTSISNQLVWYRCNETAAEMGSSPYTDRMIDYSGNNNHGTPVNINPATFCTNYFHWIYDWTAQESLSPTNPYGRLTYSTNDLTLDDATLEYEIENEIDSEEVSITGRLHRRYVIDGDDEIVQKRKFTYKCYLLDETDYTNLNVFDAQEISFFPDATDTVNYYTSNCDIDFLNIGGNIHDDYAEVFIIPRGQLQTLS